MFSGAPGTLEKYAYYFQRFERWCAAEDLPVYPLQLHSVMAYLLELIDGGPVQGDLRFAEFRVAEFRVFELEFQRAEPASQPDCRRASRAH